MRREAVELAAEIRERRSRQARRYARLARLSYLVTGLLVVALLVLWVLGVVETSQIAFRLLVLGAIVFAVLGALIAMLAGVVAGRRGTDASGVTIESVTPPEPVSASGSGTSVDAEPEGFEDDGSPPDLAH